MRSYKDNFPSRFLKVDDLKGRRLLVTIKEVTEERVGQGADADDKLIAWFQEVPKGLVLNRTNCDSIGEIVGTDDVDLWPGHRVVLYPTKTDFGGKRVPCIRIEESPTGSAPPERVSAETQSFVNELESDDEGGVQ
jgi:hypothetical protein